MNRLLSLSLLALAVTFTAGATSVPEIDPASSVNAIALVGGALLVLRNARRK